jgi:Flp pilus assembly pilin Flp
MKASFVAAVLTIAFVVGYASLAYSNAGASAEGALPSVAFLGDSATPIPQPSQTPPPDVAATPAPLAQRYAGQLLDLERGYVVFTTGDALRMVSDAVIVDDDTGAPATYAIVPGLYAIAIVDGGSGLVTSLRVGRTPRASATPIAEVPRAFVSSASSPKPNPDLAPAATLYHSKLSSAVQVTITVSVPPDTPFAADVYMATDTSGWNAQAIKMQRLDGRDFRIILQLQGGTDFHYLFTRGTWPTVERERSGLQRQARELLVNGSDALDVAAKIFRWADLP